LDFPAANAFHVKQQIGVRPNSLLVVNNNIEMGYNEL
jgi:hypothetical protein